jgi:Flp pilus assembly protein TadB
MTTGAAGPTPPEPTRPLSAREKAALARLAAETRREDPEWFDLLAQRSTPRHRPGSRARNLVIQVAVVVIMAVVLMPSAWMGGLLVAIVLIGPMGVALWAMRRGIL